MLRLDVIQANPEYEPARRLLGYQSATIRGTRSTRCESSAAGWFGTRSSAGCRSEDIRYEDGERYCDGRWIWAKDNASATATRNGWKIETEHYLIHTNSSLEAGVGLG